MTWKNYFNELARTELENHKKVGWQTKESMYAKIFPLFHVIDLNDISRLLDIGSGNGALEIEIANNYPNIRICGIDPSEEMIKISKAKMIKNTNFIMGSITHIPFEDRTFDLVACIGVLQNFNGSLDTGLDELCRVTRSGGYLYIVTLDKECKWFINGERVMNPINTYYSPEDLINSLIDRGFSIEDVKSIGLSEIDSMRKKLDFLLPLHETHTFFIFVKRR